jgi:hypothetical protein
MQKIENIAAEVQFNDFAVNQLTSMMPYSETKNISEEQFETMRDQVNQNDVTMYSEMCKGSGNNAKEQLQSREKQLLLPCAFHPAFLQDHNGHMLELRPMYFFRNRNFDEADSKVFEVRVIKTEKGNPMLVDNLSNPKINLNHENHQNQFNQDQLGVLAAKEKLEKGELEFSMQFVHPRPIYIMRANGTTDFRYMKFDVNTRFVNRLEARGRSISGSSPQAQAQEGGSRSVGRSISFSSSQAQAQEGGAPAQD